MIRITVWLGVVFYQMEGVAACGICLQVAPVKNMPADDGAAKGVRTVGRISYPVNTDSERIVTLEAVMLYRYDTDLDFLRESPQKGLETLAGYLEKSGQTLSAQEGSTPFAWDTLAAAVQHLGARAAGTGCPSGKGILYRDILQNLCGMFNIGYDQYEHTVRIERNILSKILSSAVFHMSESSKEELCGILSLDYVEDMQELNRMLLLMIRGRELVAYSVSRIAACAVAEIMTGRSLYPDATCRTDSPDVMEAVSSSLRNMLSCSGSAGSAYRALVATVLHVIYMRAQYRYAVDAR